MNLTTIYNMSPNVIQKIMINLQGYILYKQRYGKEYENELKNLKNNQERLKEVQLRELNEFLFYVRERSSYYKASINMLNLPLKDVKEISILPIIQKEDIRRNLNDIITDKKENLIKSSTGGTTGKSLVTYKTKKDIQKRIAYLDYYKSKFGVEFGMKRASFMGRNIITKNHNNKEFWRFNKPMNQMLFSSFHITSQNLNHYINALNDFKPKSIDGFPSAITKVAKFILDNNIKMEFVPLCIFPTAENLSQNDKRLIEKAFKCRVKNQYASSEGAPFITECELGNLHLNIETGVFERYSNDSDVTELLVTSFHTYGTPLIRYKIGDSVKFTDKKCNCGNDTPIIEELMGRSVDFLYSKESGTISSVNFANSIKMLPNSIIQSQFVQLDVDKIVVKLVIDEKLFSEDDIKILNRELHGRLGNKIKIDYEYVNKIETEKSGKTRMIINEIPKEKIDLI